MKRKHGPTYALAGLGLALATLSGCQTWTSGMTLPSARYLHHPPQFFAPSPPFPLTRELASQERAWAEGTGLPGEATPLPAPVPAAPLPGEPPPVPLPPPPAGGGMPPGGM